MILQFFESNKEWAYTQADVISSRRFNWSEPIKKYAKTEPNDSDAREIILSGKSYWVHNSDVGNIIAEQNQMLKDEIGSNDWFSDDGNSYMSPEIAIVTLKNFNKAPIYITVSRSAYLLNDNGKTINSVLG